MKRTPLKRKTPLKRTGFKKKGILDLLAEKLGFKKPQSTDSPKPRRTKLKSMSKDRRQWHQKYKDSVSRDSPYQRCAMTNVMEHKSDLDLHHPFGRKGNRILAYIHLTRSAHDWVHDNGKEAYAQGWLQPQFRGMPPIINHPRPWPKSAERTWPDELKRKD